MIETLADLASSFPSAVIEAMALMVEGADMEYKVQYWSPHLRQAISTAIEKREVDAAVLFINKLAAHGFVDFRDLLP